jgi:hypothetical protein
VKQLFEPFDRLRNQIAIVDHHLALAFNTTVALERAGGSSSTFKSLPDGPHLRRKVF